jgi:hypothetical protein
MNDVEALCDGQQDYVLESKEYRVLWPTSNTTKKKFLAFILYIGSLETCQEKEKLITEYFQDTSLKSNILDFLAFKFP